MKERLEAITEATLIPLSVLGVLLGGMAWLTSLSDTVVAASKKIESLEASQEGYVKDMREVRERLIRIEEALRHGSKK